RVNGEPSRSHSAPPSALTCSMLCLSTALLALLLATGKVAGSPSGKGEGPVLTTPALPVANVSTISLGHISYQFVPEQLTDSMEDEDEDEEEEDYSEDYDLSGSEEQLQDGMSLPKVQAVVKPQNKERKRKGPRKGKGKKNKNGQRRKRDPCKTTYKDYCIHGECRYLKDLKMPSCICLPGYQNERCGIQVLHTGKDLEHFDGLTVTLIVVGVSLFVLALAAVTVTMALHLRRKMRAERESVNEEKQKLRSENAIGV
ncbi:uncharacterized protein LOC144593876, partial [Rhinoraja longicauda]